MARFSLACLALLTASASAQDYRFEVASIRPGDPSGRLAGPPAPPSPRRFTSESASIVSLAMKAFDARQRFEVEYPPWMQTTYFNVIAAIPEGASAADLPVMIRHLLEDRFGLVFHREARTMAGYELVVAKSGPKLAKSAARARASGEPAGKRSEIEMKNGVPQFAKDAGSGHLLTLTTALWRGRNRTMKQLAEDLAQYLGAPVLDATGVEGEFDYDLTFTPEARAALPAEDVPANPLLRVALQGQLGLRLQAIKNVPVTVLVLDSARKEPTEN
jgi:uncharacterized protein (TIGR03435 family)